MKKRLLSMGMVICAVTIAGVFALLPARDGVTKENLDRVGPGMTMQEVETVFGKPATDKNHLPSTDGIVPGVVLSWKSNNGSRAFVYFQFPDGRAYDKDWWERKETIEDKLRRLSRWPWW